MDIQPLQILFQIINFGVVAGALTYLLYKPVLKILEERSSKIAQAQKAAEASLKEKEELEAMHKKAKSDTEKKAAAILTEAKTSAEEQGKQIISEAKNQAKKEIEKLRAQWEEEKAKANRAMKQEFNDAVLAVSEKVLGSALDKKAHTKLIEKEIKTLTKAA